MDGHYVLVQYYDMLDKESISKDGMDNKLNYMGLKWKRDGEDDEGMEKVMV